MRERERGQVIGRGWYRVLCNALPVITALGVASAASEPQISVAFSAVPPTSATTYHLETADSADGAWAKVITAVLRELEPDRYQFTLPFDAARAVAFWRVIETVP